MYDSTCMKYPQVVKFMGTESGMMFIRRWVEVGMGICCLMGIAFWFCKMEKSRDRMHNNGNVVNTIELYTLK